MLDEFVAVPAFDAEGSVIDRVVAVRGNAGDEIVFNVQVQTASASAPGTGSGNFFHTGLL
jgi:hypothetical protein